MDWQTWLAADGPGTVNIGVLSQYGVLGLVCAGLVWFARGAYQESRDRARALEEENKRLNALMIDRIVPLLTGAAELLRTLQAEREQERLFRQVKGGGSDHADPK